VSSIPRSDPAAPARLIVTADDVGLDPGMTEGALRAHRDGIVTACSVVANGRAVEDAATRLREQPRLAVGIHFTLVGESAIAPPDRIRSLLSRDGRLLPDWPALVRRWALGRLDLDQVEIELRAQVRRLRELGLAPCHANGHQHLHVLPGVFARVAKIAAHEGIGYLRVPHEPLDSGWPPTRGAARRLALAALERCGRRARRQAAGGGFVLPDLTPGLALAGHLDEPALLALLPRLRGLAELVVHPGVGGHLIRKHYAWGYTWDVETSALCSAMVRQALTDLEIVLTSMPAC
jgi:predicted glycoside hydrolase/deacetylase ChbG (UPF0249 family)